MPDISKISKWQCLFRFFEGAVWEHNVGSFRTEILRGRNIINRPEIAIPIATELSRLREVNDNHWRLQVERRGRVLPQVPSPGIGNIIDPAQQEIENQISQLLGDDEQFQVVGQPAAPTAPRMPTGVVHPAQIELIEISDDSRVEATVFPLSFNCAFCGHYEIIDRNAPTDLQCPCCRAYCRKCDRQVEQADSEVCGICGENLGHSSLKQYNIVYACPRCGRIEELTPRLINRNQINRTIECPDCHQGHLHLRLPGSGSLTAARWQCTNHHCGFSERLDKHCVCHIAADDTSPSIPSIMKPTPTSASIAVPLIRSYLWLGRNEVTLESLKLYHDETKNTDVYPWKLSTELPSIELQMVAHLYGILDAFSIPQIKTTTVIFGYRSGISSYPHRIEEHERLAHLFTDGRASQRYRAYLADTNGRALVVMLSKERVMQTLINTGFAQPDEIYDSLAQRCIDYLSTGQFQEVVAGLGPLALAKLMHSYEHALFKTLINQVGMEVFGGKILLSDCAIIFYEREEVGPGGLVQVSNSGQFLELLRRASHILRNCPQMCTNACMACLFVNDYYCQPYLPGEVQRWIPPNALLDRRLTKALIQGGVGTQR